MSPELPQVPLLTMCLACIAIVTLVSSVAILFTARFRDVIKMPRFDLD